MTQPHTMPQDFTLTPGDIQYAKSKGFCEPQIMEELESFKRHFIHGPGCKTKWKLWSTGNGAWGTWIQKANKWPAWKVEQAEREQQAERHAAEVDQMALGLKQASKARGRPHRKPKIKRLPYAPGSTPEQIQAMKMQIFSAEPETPKRPAKPMRNVSVPMPAHLRGKIITPADKEPPND